MRGYVIQEKGRADWQDVPVPEIGPYDALVRPTAVATCTTDVHLIDSLSLPNALGKVIGHEAVGVVETADSLVSDFAPGDRVVMPEGLADWRHPRAARRGQVPPEQEPVLLRRPRQRRLVLRAGQADRSGLP